MKSAEQSDLDINYLKFLNEILYDSNPSSLVPVFLGVRNFIAEAVNYSPFTSLIKNYINNILSVFHSQLKQHEQEVKVPSKQTCSKAIQCYDQNPKILQKSQRLGGVYIIEHSIQKYKVQLQNKMVQTSIIYQQFQQINNDWVVDMKLTQQKIGNLSAHALQDWLKDILNDYFLRIGSVRFSTRNFTDLMKEGIKLMSQKGPAFQRLRQQQQQQRKSVTEKVIAFKQRVQLLLNHQQSKIKRLSFCEKIKISIQPDLFKKYNNKFTSDYQKTLICQNFNLKAMYNNYKELALKLSQENKNNMQKILNLRSYLTKFIHNLDHKETVTPSFMLRGFSPSSLQLKISEICFLAFQKRVLQFLNSIQSPQSQMYNIIRMSEDEKQIVEEEKSLKDLKQMNLQKVFSIENKSTDSIKKRKVSFNQIIQSIVQTQNFQDKFYQIQNDLTQLIVKNYNTHNVETQTFFEISMQSKVHVKYFQNIALKKQMKQLKFAVQFSMFLQSKSAPKKFTSEVQKELSIQQFQLNEREVCKETEQLLIKNQDNQQIKQVMHLTKYNIKFTEANQTLKSASLKPLKKRKFQHSFAISKPFETPLEEIQKIQIRPSQTIKQDVNYRSHKAKQSAHNTPHNKSLSSILQLYSKFNSRNSFLSLGEQQLPQPSIQTSNYLKLQLVGNTTALNFARSSQQKTKVKHKQSCTQTQEDLLSVWKKFQVQVKQFCSPIDQYVKHGLTQCHFLKDLYDHHPYSLAKQIESNKNQQKSPREPTAKEVQLVQLYNQTCNKIYQFNKRSCNLNIKKTLNIRSVSKAKVKDRAQSLPKLKKLIHQN